MDYLITLNLLLVAATLPITYLYRKRKWKETSFANSEFWISYISAQIAVTILVNSVIFIGGVIFMAYVFSDEHYTDDNIVYGKPVLYGEYDGLMDGDILQLYDNNTFSLQLGRTFYNGNYITNDDSIYLKYTVDLDVKNPPCLIVADSNYLSLYRWINGQYDTLPSHFLSKSIIGN